MIDKPPAAQNVSAEGNSRANLATFATGAGISLVGSVGGRGLFTLTQIFLARWLGPGIFGLYAIGWTILRMTSLFTPLGVDKGIIRFGAEYLNRDKALFRKVTRYSLGIATLSGFIVGLALFMLAPIIEVSYNKPGLGEVIKIFAVSVPLYAVLRVANATTRITQKTQYTVYSENILQPVANILLLLVVFMAGGKLFGAAASASISFILATFLALYYVRKLFPQLRIAERSTEPVLRPLLSYSLPTALAGTFALSIVWIDQLFIGYFLPSSAAGIYQAVTQSSVLFALILGSITAIFAPMIATYYANSEIDRLQDLYRVATKWGFYLNLPLLLVIALTSRELMISVFGEPYADGWLPLRILLIGQAVNILTGTVVPLLTMTGHQNRWFYISASMFLLNVVLNLLLIPRIGLPGAAIGTTCAITGLYLLALFQVRHLLGIWPYDRRHYRVLLAMLIALIISLIYQYFFSGVFWLDVVVYLTIAYGSVGMIILLKGLDEGEKELFMTLKQKISKGSFVDR